MPQNKMCNHPSCDGEPCRSLTAEERKPSEADLAEGKRLVADGWFQTSRKFRGVARIKPEFANAEFLLRPEIVNTEVGQAIADAWRQAQRRRVGFDGNHPDYVEHRDLSVPVFEAFRRAGGC